MKINPYLVARFMAVQEAFLQPGLRPAMAMANAGIATTPKKFSWEDLLPPKEEDEGDGGGGGAQRGFRGKNSEYAKAVAKARSMKR